MKNKRFALIILFVCVFVSVFPLGARGLNAERYEALNIYKNGESADGVSVCNDFAVVAEKAYTLDSLSKKYLNSQYNFSELSDKIHTYSENQPRKAAYDSLEQILVLATDIISKLSDNKGVTENDMKTAQRAVTEIQSRKSTISHDKYNETA
ncbi:MAG: hypothetical protein LBM16_05380, partial [Clostridiales bacterium]|nr:hypothetical protein [Clostridiales bacterium]